MIMNEPKRKRGRPRKYPVSSKNVPVTNETEEVVPTPKTETSPSKIEDYEGTRGTGETPAETVPVGTGDTKSEEPYVPSSIHTTKPLDPPTQARLERIVNYCLEKWNEYRDSLIKR